MMHLRPRTLRGWPAALPLAALLLAGCEKNAAGPTPPIDLASLSCDAAAGSITLNGQTTPTTPGGYATAGNYVISTTSCAPHRFVGVNLPRLSWSPTDPRLATDAMARADFDRIRSWGANVVRLAVSQSFWLPQNKHYHPGYKDLVDRAVRQANAAGLDVIIALQTSDRGESVRFPDLQQMPDMNHSVPFWREVATRYKGNGRVVFELYNEPFHEPHKDDWNLWLNGGKVSSGESPYHDWRDAFEAAGMQDLYDVVRATGANNLVIVGGLHWAYYLTGLPEHEVNGHNIAYTVHLWDFPNKQPSKWEKDWGFLKATHPVMITEFGNYDCSSNFVTPVLDYADQHDLSWVAWAWLAPEAGDSPDRVCKFPLLITDWQGTPSNFGKIVKDRLARY